MILSACCSDTHSQAASLSDHVCRYYMKSKQVVQSVGVFSVQLFQLEHTNVQLSSLLKVYIIVKVMFEFDTCVSFIVTPTRFSTM